ncbi:MAG: dienelactone hydrolase family protein [Croceibacterium sp.]
MRLVPYLALVAAALATPVQAQDAVPASAAAEHYYSLPAAAPGKPRPWVVILPGGGGIKVFGDDRVYFDAARHWNAQGYDALIIHYQAVWDSLPGAKHGTAGQREARVFADGLTVAKQRGWIDAACPGLVVGYSMGGEGTLTLSADRSTGLAGAIAYYRSVKGQPAGYTPAMPVLLLQGQADQVAPEADLDQFLARATDRTLVRVERYPGAHHGFDIPSIVEPYLFQGMPFLFNSTHAATAVRAADTFARQAVAADPRAAACVTPNT